MSATAVVETGFEISDVTGQKVLAVSGMPEDVTVSELVQGLVGKMRLPLNDASGRPLSYHARLDREGRHLQGAERVAEAVRSGDRVVLQPNVDAGGSGSTSTGRA
ncbi:MAG: hypothetical protein EHM89_06020 [Acidobacteria bacterium]|nr:MAG: hypothetical protein EHM89_06020 [Acidobacteriota bacterium]